MSDDDFSFNLDFIKFLLRMSISIYIVPIEQGELLVRQLLHDSFGISEVQTGVLFKKAILSYFSKFKEHTYILAETQYVDKVYRDSYYHYYSSKLQYYKRDSVRLSFFEGEITDTDFKDGEKHAQLQDQYRGFIVLRPTEPFIIGRSVISPFLFKEKHYSICISKFHTTANGVKFTVKGFPHSSQDNETISCAETCLWAIMEYFSNKYSYYQPVLPSKIIQTLRKVSSERQVPSKGLNIAQMSYALKAFGFASKIYSRAQYSNEFEGLLSCYVESGIPLIVAMDNIHEDGNIGHALLAIGHSPIPFSAIDDLAEYQSADKQLSQVLLERSIILYDFDFVDKEFIFIDDNHPPYQKASLKQPALHYKSEWHNCELSYFIVALYPKIYLEAYEAKNYVRNFIINGPFPLNAQSELVLRFFMASSRSFKDVISKNEPMQEELKSILIETAMPKFIWVAELSTKSLIKDGLVQGILVIDATEANIYSTKPLIFAAYQDSLLLVDEFDGGIVSHTFELMPFWMFAHNLTDF